MNSQQLGNVGERNKIGREIKRDELGRRFDVPWGFLRRVEPRHVPFPLPLLLSLSLARNIARIFEA